MAYGLSPDPKFQFFDDNGDPIAGGKLFTYGAGSATPQATYADSAGTANDNPVELDAAGRATIYLSSASYKFILKNAAETVTYWTQDNISNFALSLLTSTDTLTNKTLDSSSTITIKDANFTLQDDAGATKQAKFQLSGITAGQTRTITLPDASITLVGSASPTFTGTVAVTDADSLTVGGVIVPQHIEATFHAQAAASMVDQSFFVATRAYQVTAVRFVHAVAETTAANLRVQLTKDVSTNAPGAGTDLLTNNSNAGFDCKATANTVQTGTLTGTAASLQLAAGDRLSVDFEAAATELAGVTMTVSLKRI